MPSRDTREEYPESAEMNAPSRAPSIALILENRRIGPSVSGVEECVMRRSTERVLTTHTGSLPRPDDLIRMMYAKEEGVPVDPAALAARVKAAVAEVVKKQADAGG